MKLYAIYKNGEFIGFPFNSYESAHMMLLSLKELLDRRHDTEIINGKLYVADLNQIYLIRVI